MTKVQGVLGLVGICLVVILLSFAGLVSDFITHLLGSLDGLLLLMISLMMAGLFFLMLFLIAKEEGWLSSFHKRSAAVAVKSSETEKPTARVSAGGTGEGK